MIRNYNGTIADWNENLRINPLANLPIYSEILVREAVNKLKYGDMSLPYLPGQPDTNLIEILNNNLTESEIQQILEFVGSRTFDNNILKLILRNLDTDVLNTFLTLADGTGLGIRQYAEFANLLSYVYPGIRHPNTAIYVLKAAMVEILTENVPVININEELNNAVQNANESLSSPEQTNEMARRNFNSIISQALNRNWTNFAWNTVLFIGGYASMFYGQPWLVPILSVVGGRILSNNIQSNNNSLNQLELNNSSERTLGNTIDDFINLVRNFFRTL